MEEINTREHLNEGKGLSSEDWDVLYEHGGKEISFLKDLFEKVFQERYNNGLYEPFKGETIGELMAYIPEEDRNKIYKLFGRAILNCKKKGYLTNIKLK